MCSIWGQWIEIYLFHHYSAINREFRGKLVEETIKNAIFAIIALLAYYSLSMPLSKTVTHSNSNPF